MSRFRPALLAFLGVGLTGCISFHSLSDDLAQRIEREAEPLAPKIDDDDGVRSVGTAALRSELPEPEELILPESPTCADYARFALLRNPRIQARVRDLQALGLLVPQVSSLGDPMLEFVPPTPGMLQTAAGQMQWGLGLSQTIPYPGKLAASGEVAERVVRIAVENLEAERKLLVAQVKSAYSDLFAAHAALRASRAMEPLLQELRVDVNSRFAAGRADFAAVQRVEDELDMVTDSCTSLEFDIRTATARLNVLMDRAIDVPLAEPTAPELEPLRWHLTALIERAIELNPQLAAMRAEVARDLANIDLAEEQYHPDFSIGGMFNAIMGGISPVANGRDAFALSLGLSLPVGFDRLRAGVLQRNAETLASVLRYRSARNELSLALQELVARVDASYRRGVLLRDRILPRVHRSLDAARVQYETGGADLGALIELARRELELTLDEQRARARLASDLAEIERLAGGELPTEEVIR